MTTRLKIILRGAVQGVGFRPFVYRLAAEADLNGWVNNSPQGVFIEVEGPRAGSKRSCCGSKPKDRRAVSSKASNPPGSIRSVTRASKSARATPAAPRRRWCCRTSPPAPIACAKSSTRTNRRHRYPFTNCTNCGPRFSIIESLPYDRANTSMRAFTMCPECQAEYDDPRDRRFHAQPNACPVCGPQLGIVGPRRKGAAVDGAAPRDRARHSGRRRRHSPRPDRRGQGRGRLPSHGRGARTTAPSAACASESIAKKSRCPDVPSLAGVKEL